MGFLNIGLVTSGRGTMLSWVLEACERRITTGKVVAVVSNIDCPALHVARRAGVPHIANYPLDRFGSRPARDEAMGNALVRASVNFVVVAGYTQPLDSRFLDFFPDRAISMYPALLPAFGELDEAIGPALEYGVKTIGMTFHFRAPDSLSNGAIIAQEPIPVEVDDTVESVLPRITAVEKTMLFDILRAFGEDQISRDGNKVRYRQPRPSHEASGPGR
jgi:phosphoribosylglycinamide formyltransferase-1